MITRTRLLIGSVVALGAIGATTLTIQSSQTGAEEVPPLVAQVNDHEDRIGTLETQQTDTAAKVEQNTESITVLQQTTGTTTSPGTPIAITPDTTTTTEPSQPTTQEPAPEPTPQPAPEPSGWTIMAVGESVSGSLRACDYTLYSQLFDNSIGIVKQPLERPCQKVGEEFVL